MEVEEQLGSCHGHLVCGASTWRPTSLERPAAVWNWQLGTEQGIAGIVPNSSFFNSKLDHFLRESIVETDTLRKKDTISVSKNDFNALEIVTNEIHENDKHTNGNVITIGITGSLDAPPPQAGPAEAVFGGL